MKTIELEGILPAMVTPFTPSGDAVDEEALGALTERLIKAGAGGLIPCGSTGEFPTLSNAERKRVTEIVIAAANHRVPVAPGTGALSTNEAIELSKHAEGAGAAAVMVVPPFYEPLRWEELVAHYRAIADSIDIPIIFYNIPSASGTHLSPKQIGNLASIEGVQFVKDSSADMVALTELINRHGQDISIFNGWDSLTFYGLLAGTRASIWGAANVIPDLCVQLFDSIYRRSDLSEARLVWDKIWPICYFLENEGYVSSVKAGCELVGMTVGPPRRPLLPLSEDARGRLANVLERAGAIQKDAIAAR